MSEFRLPVIGPNAVETIKVAKTLVVIDSAVDYCPTLTTEVAADTDAIVLDPTEDGVVQITAALARYRNLEKLHIVSFSSPEGLYLGNGVLNLENLHGYVHPLMEWADSLKPNADIHLYGCNVTFDRLGRELVEKLSALTGARVAVA